ncbi:rRNA maturation RNase YbeY [bacterium]|nr:MAG: rRNA maturation RNase YbeY [bacterium]
MKIVMNFAQNVGGKPDLESIVSKVKDVASSMAPRDGVIELNLVGKRRMTYLNKEYKGRRGAAEILTFDYSESDDDLDYQRDGQTLGEIYIYYGKIARSADRLGISRKAYLLRIIVHGLCHLQGYGHGDEIQARKMEEVEKRLLSPILKKEEMAVLFG